MSLFTDTCCLRKPRVANKRLESAGELFVQNGSIQWHGTIFPWKLCQKDHWNWQSGITIAWDTMKSWVVSGSAWDRVKPEVASPPCPLGLISLFQLQGSKTAVPLPGWTRAVEKSPFGSRCLRGLISGSKALCHWEPLKNWLWDKINGTHELT